MTEPSRTSQMALLRPFVVASAPRTSVETLALHARHGGAPVANLFVPQPDHWEEAILAATRPPRTGAPTDRAQALDRAATALDARHEELVALAVGCQGTPLLQARTIVRRAVLALRWAADAALALQPRRVGRLEVVAAARGPTVVVATAPVSLHIVTECAATAIAAGAPLMLMPQPGHGAAACILGEVLGTALAESGLPPESVSVLPVPPGRASKVVRDPRLPVVLMTGPAAFGVDLRHNAPDKRVLLEHGGTPAALVFADCDLDWAAGQVARYCTQQAAFACVGAQRVLVQRAVYEPFLDLVVSKIAELVVGDPALATTDVGPLPTEAALVTVQNWVDDAVSRGARLLCGGERTGAYFAPTVLSDVAPECTPRLDEVCGPVVTIGRFDTVDQAFDDMNRLRERLPVGAFTGSPDLLSRLHRSLPVDLIANTVPSLRLDPMPFDDVVGPELARRGVARLVRALTYDKTLVWGTQ